MMIENTMVTGYGKPDEVLMHAKGIFEDYAPEPVYRCERCKDTLMRNTIVYEWGGFFLFVFVMFFECFSQKDCF